MTLEPGLRAAFHYAVTAADTAAAVGSGQVPVLATPRVLALVQARRGEDGGVDERPYPSGP